MILYHGSKEIIEYPQFGKGNPKNDYGLGFYCTESLELAKEWACSSNKENGFANVYEIDLNGLKILDLRDTQYSILNWMAILLKFRTFDVNNPLAERAKEYLIENFYLDIKEFDLIIGYRADDSYFSFAKDFINNSITTEQLSQAMHLGELGTQIVIKSEKAFNKLTYLKSELADCKEYFLKRSARDNLAREKYFTELRKMAADGLYMIDIIRKGVRNGDKII